MTKPTITDLPMLPARTSAEPNFDEMADAFFEGLVGLPAEMNMAIDYFDAKATEVDADATAVEVSRQEVASKLALAVEAVDDAKGHSQDAEGYSDSAAAIAAATGSAAGLPSMVNKAGYVMTVNEGEDAPDWAQTSQFAVYYEEFLTSATYTKRTGTVFAIVHANGGGESGARGAILSYAGGGGGAGLRCVVPASLIGATETVTVGLGGAALGSDGLGVPGGDSSFGAILIAPGGGSRQEINTNGFGGGGEVPSVAGTFATGTQTSGAGASFANSSSRYLDGAPSIYGGGGGGGRGGAGGLSQLAGDGGAGGAASTDGGDGAFPGGGGGGSYNPSGGATSGAGGDGVVRIWSFVLEAV